MKEEPRDDNVNNDKTNDKLSINVTQQQQNIPFITMTDIVIDPSPTDLVNMDDSNDMSNNGIELDVVDSAIQPTEGEDSEGIDASSSKSDIF